MKLNSLNLISNVQNASSIKATTKQNNIAHARINAICPNSLQEAIGRSQVAFLGNGKETKEGFYYEQAGIFGKVNENIKYDEETGTLVYREFMPNGNLKQEMVFSPQTKTRSTFIMQDNDVSKTVLSTPEGKKTQYKDLDERLLCQIGEQPNGKKYVSEFDYRRGRNVTRFYDKNVKVGTRVFDLETRQEVFSGEHVIDNIKGEDGIVRKTNIITGQVYGTKEIVNGDEITRTFSPETGLLTLEVRKNKYTITTTRYNKGVRYHEKEQEIKTNTTTYTEFSEDGQNITKKHSITKDSKGRPISEIKYDPVTLCIVEELETNYNNNTKTLHKHAQYTGLREYSATFSESPDRLIKETYYFADGKTPSMTREFDDNNYSTETWYYEGKKNIPSAKIIKDAEDKFVKFIQIAPNGRVFETREPHPNIDNQMIITHYDEYSGKRTTKEIVRSDEFKNTGDFRECGTLLVRYYYDESGKHREFSDSYNPDKTFIRRQFDRNNKVIAENLCNPDGTIIY
ncbi:MAG: hypothetical protein IJW73_08060 [Candidatus Gastranaerophilales bacterium]|nr:hypothetical protein [Candidatus Gastranaerophilales bacterium]